MGPPGSTFSPFTKASCLCNLGFFVGSHGRGNMIGFEEECCAFGYSFWNQR